MTPCSREPCPDLAVAVVRTENPRTGVTTEAGLCAHHRDALLARTRVARVVRSLPHAAAGAGAQQQAFFEPSEGP